MNRRSNDFFTIESMRYIHAYHRNRSPRFPSRGCTRIQTSINVENFCMADRLQDFLSGHVKSKWLHMTTCRPRNRIRLMNRDGLSLRNTDYPSYVMPVNSYILNGLQLCLTTENIEKSVVDTVEPRLSEPIMLQGVRIILFPR